MEYAYFDHAATTKPDPAVAEEIRRGLLQVWGNPSSSYRPGLDAQLAVRSAKDQLATLLHITREEIYFTSGGTEGNNTCIRGAAKALQRRGNGIVTSLAEHSSVVETVQQLEKEGFACTYLRPGKDGTVCIHDLEQAIDAKTILVSLMLINNETGGVHDIARMVKVVRQKAPLAIIHCDLVSALGKTPLNLSKLGVDLATVSAHKINGPKGCGAIYVKKGVRILPLLFGGIQQNKLRPGTESVPLILGFGKAASLRQENLAAQIEHAAALKEIALQELQKLEGVTIHSAPESCPFLLSFSTNRVRSETMLHALDEAGFLVSAGSACGGNAKSHVLTAMGLPNKEIDTALRISFGWENTAEQTKALIETVGKLCNRLQNAY